MLFVCNWRSLQGPCGLLPSVVDVCEWGQCGELRGALWRDARCCRYGCVQPWSVRTGHQGGTRVPAGSQPVLQSLLYQGTSTGKEGHHPPQKAQGGTTSAASLVPASSGGKRRWCPAGGSFSSPLNVPPASCSQAAIWPAIFLTNIDCF